MKKLIHIECISENAIFMQFYVIIPDLPSFIQTALSVIRNNCFLFLFLMDLPMVKLIKLAKMAGVMHEADHAYSIRSTW